MKVLKMSVNQFLNATRDNYLKAVALSNYHLAALKQAVAAAPADAELASMLVRFTPIDEAYQEAYTKWKSGGGVQSGAMLSIQQLMALMKDK